MAGGRGGGARKKGQGIRGVGEGGVEASIGLFIVS